MPNNKEEERVQAVQRYLGFNTDRQKDLQEIVMLASVICNSPIALITLMDYDVQLIKAKLGVDADEMPRNTSFCTHAIQMEKIMVVKDASKDTRFANAPVVVNNPHIRFYASANLKSYDGYNVGTLCVYDTKPKDLTEQQLECLGALANQVSHIMELDRSLNQLKAQNTSLREIARIQSHEIRQPVASIMGLMALMKDSSGTNDEEYLGLLEASVNQLDERIRTIVNHINDQEADNILR
ncbi:GAF domain-containing protein [Daejeonella rubra]|uniref:histidine kinase n=1 Tax=Daejeonella rubra TaxID=990371 RepID=A0A1G9YZ72_9SPHI|nr:GAF domain-containing protein [Daejeonella rubra]SDN14428.1 GAF domain-containing protein [Daejeonella rubra]